MTEAAEPVVEPEVKSARKWPCWLIGHRPLNAEPIDNVPGRYFQTCSNCGKGNFFRINERGRYDNTGWGVLTEQP